MKMSFPDIDFCHLENVYHDILLLFSLYVFRQHYEFDEFPPRVLLLACYYRFKVDNSPLNINIRVVP